MAMRIIGVRLPTDLVRQIQEIARYEGRTTSSVIRSLLLHALLEVDR